MILFKFEKGTITIDSNDWVKSGQTTIKTDTKTRKEILNGTALTGGVLAIKQTNKGYMSLPSDIDFLLTDLKISFKISGKFKKTIEVINDKLIY